MRFLIALLITTAPALAHPGHGVHLHEAQGFWIAALAFTLGMALTLRVVAKAAKARA